ncbi:type I pantothenate kinase, partial [Escherichia coli]|nr:type I pantothenate kinase [Escherichia coli]
YSKLSREESMEIASSIWQEINGLNLKQNILPTKERASLILTKGQSHTITNVRLRK